ncbi:MAG: serine protease [Blastomonas sp.]
MSSQRKRNRRGCLPWVLGAVLLWIWFSGDDAQWQDAPLTVERYDPRSPRRPMPEIGESFVIADPGPQQNSQGTAFAVDRDGTWLTAQHVTNGCARLGLVSSRGVEALVDVFQSTEADVTVIRQGPQAQFALALTDEIPSEGSLGYHMGFPAGEPTVVVSRYIGQTFAQRGGPGGVAEPILAWAEGDRFPPGDGPLGGISGGPTFDQQGRVVGVNAASTPRRGRVLTTDPQAILRLVEASAAVDEPGVMTELATPASAAALFRALLDRGIIRQVYCGVR